MALGMLVFMVDFTLLQATLYPFHFHYRYYFTKKNWVVGIQFEKCIFFKLKNLKTFFPSIDLREVLLQ